MDMVAVDLIGMPVDHTENGLGRRQKEAGEMVEQRKPCDIVDRTFQLALGIVRFCKECGRRKSSARALAPQLLRSGTSVGANVGETQDGRSRADFVSKYAIALKEAREANYWLRLLIESGDCPLESGTPLCQEAEELKRIIASIIVKAKQSTAAK